MAIRQLTPTRFVNLAADPPNAERGWIYFNTTSGKLRICTAAPSTWEDVPAAGVAAGAPTMAQADRIVERDSFRSTEQFTERYVQRDALRSTEQFTERYVTRDGQLLTVGSLSAPKADSIFFKPQGAVNGETHRATVSAIRARASGTANTDPQVDAYINQASAAANFGSATALEVKAAGVSDARHALLQWDFTRHTGWTRLAGGVHRITLGVTNPTALAMADLTFKWMTKAAPAPFTESSVTWNTNPADTTTLRTDNPSLPAGTAIYTTTFTDAQMATILGNFLWVRVTSAGLATTTWQIASREADSAINSPIAAFALTR